MTAAATVNNSYPQDAIGNYIRKGKAVNVKLSEQNLIFRVAEVEPAGTVTDGNGNPMALNGTLVLTVTIPLQFGPNAVLPHILVLQEPEQEAVKVADRVPQMEIVKQ